MGCALEIGFCANRWQVQGQHQVENTKTKQRAAPTSPHEREAERELPELIGKFESISGNSLEREDHTYQRQAHTSQQQECLTPRTKMCQSPRSTGGVELHKATSPSAHAAVERALKTGPIPHRTLFSCLRLLSRSVKEPDQSASVYLDDENEEEVT